MLPYYLGATLKQTNKNHSSSFLLPGVAKEQKADFLTHPICIILPVESSLQTASIFIFLRKSENTLPSAEGIQAYFLCLEGGGWRCQLRLYPCLREMQVKKQRRA